MKLRLCAAVLTLVCAGTAAEARKLPRRDSAVARHCVWTNSGRVTCAGVPNRRIGGLPRVTDANGNRIIGGRPAGCPRRYCGCGAARYLGRHDPRLNLAWNWARLFPRASAGPGKAAVWRHHIALIVQMVGPRKALLRDYNSGGGLSRLHVRSIAGAVIVDPGARVASND